VASALSHLFKFAIYRVSARVALRMHVTLVPRLIYFAGGPEMKLFVCSYFAGGAILDNETDKKQHTTFSGSALFIYLYKRVFASRPLALK